MGSLGLDSTSKALETAVAPSMLRLATTRFTSPYHPSNLHEIEKSMKKKSTFWKMVMKVAVVESGERLGNQAAPVKLSWPITAPPNCKPINTKKYNRILTLKSKQTNQVAPFKLFLLIPCSLLMMPLNNCKQELPSNTSKSYTQNKPTCLQLHFSLYNLFCSFCFFALFHDS